MTETKEGRLLWEPSDDFKRNSNLAKYTEWVNRNVGKSLSTYDELWEWSTTDLEGFWASIWDYCEVDAGKTYEKVIGSRSMPGAEWFPGAEVNYAKHVLRHAKKKADQPALISFSESRGGTSETTWRELESQAASIAASLKELGVEKGDRVVGYLPNVPEAISTFLAVASIGAVWSGGSPDFGAGSVIDRFQQIEPKVLFAVDGYRYGGRDFDRTSVLNRLQDGIPSLEHTVFLPYLSDSPDTSSLDNVILWDEFVGRNEGATLTFEEVAFDHPLWVLYSSGTTGLPKAIVQSQGGILVEHFKALLIQMNVSEDDRFFWFTTTGWMMWNIVVASLLSGATALLYDGNPGYPDMNAVWKFAEETKMTTFGTSASYLVSCMKAEIEPGNDFDLSNLEAVGSTGSPLPPEGFDWVYEHVKPDLWLFSTSGGTDLCTAFVGGVATRPVRSGELQGPSLGAKVQAFDEEGKPHIGKVGELVVTEPMPSMPVYLWNDPDGEKLEDSYFAVYPGIWRHGDWLLIKEDGGCVIYGRSDSTINRGGVRMGTAEIYSAVESVEEVADSLVVDVSRDDGSSVMPLFVVLKDGKELDEDLKKRIKAEIRDRCSPRHTPDDIYQIDEVPRTLNGKKLEVPIKKILSGTPPEEAASKDSLANPKLLDRYAEFAGKL